MSFVESLGSDTWRSGGRHGLFACSMTNVSRLHETESGWMQLSGGCTSILSSPLVLDSQTRRPKPSMSLVVRTGLFSGRCHVKSPLERTIRQRCVGDCRGYYD